MLHFLIMAAECRDFLMEQKRGIKVHQTMEVDLLKHGHLVLPPQTKTSGLNTYSITSLMEAHGKAVPTQLLGLISSVCYGMLLGEYFQPLERTTKTGMLLK